MDIASETARRHRGRDVPEKGSAVPAAGDEALVVRGDGQAEDLVAVGGVGLDESALGCGGLGLGVQLCYGGAREGVIEADAAVC